MTHMFMFVWVLLLLLIFQRNSHANISSSLMCSKAVPCTVESIHVTQ